MLTWIIVCIATGVIGMSSIGLSGFLPRVEEEEICCGCNQCNTCIGRRKIGRDSNLLSECMLLTYWMVGKKCEHIHKTSALIRIIYFIINACIVSVLFWSGESNLECIVSGITAAMLLALGVVDWNTQYIPAEYTCIIFLCGLIHLFADFSNWSQYLIGLIAVSGFLCIVNWIATPILRKQYGDDEIDSVIGDGDIKLMAATGLLLGWKLNFIALGIGCIAGSVIHLILMKVKGSGRQFAFGPYLSLGVYITMICGEQLVSWYLNILGVNTLL